MKQFTVIINVILILISFNSVAMSTTPLLFELKDEEVSSNSNIIDEVFELDVINYSIEDLKLLESYQIKLGNKQFTIIPTKTTEYADKNLSIIGYFLEYGQTSEYYAVFTIGEHGIVGDYFVDSGH